MGIKLATDVTLVLNTTQWCALSWEDIREQLPVDWKSKMSERFHYAKGNGALEDIMSDLENASGDCIIYGFGDKAWVDEYTGYLSFVVEELI